MANIKKNENKPKAPQNKTKRKVSDTAAAQAKKAIRRIRTARREQPKNHRARAKAIQESLSKSKGKKEN